MEAVEVLKELRERAILGHRMSCSDPNDPKRRTHYGDAAKMAESLLIVLDLHRPVCTVAMTGCDRDECTIRSCGTCGTAWPCPTAGAIINRTPTDDSAQRAAHV